MSTHVIDVDQSDFPSSVLQRSHEVPVVVDFWAEWCGPCKVLSPTLERLAEEYAGGWLLAKVDVDRNQQLAQQFGVQGIPTIVAFVDGEAIDRFTGALGEPQVRAFLDSIVPSELDERARIAEAALDAGDLEPAEAGFREVLASDPGHEAAGVGLASILLDRGDADGAIEALSPLAKSEPVRRLEAAARLSAGSDDLETLRTRAETGAEADRVAYAKSLVAHGDLAQGLDILISLVEERGEHAEEARLVTLDLFELLGADNGLVAEYRKRLASALF